jgi:hypothetical protein
MPSSLVNRRSATTKNYRTIPGVNTIPGVKTIVITHIFLRNVGRGFQPADAGDSIKPEVERFSAEPQVCVVEIHLACGAGGRLC